MDAYDALPYDTRPSRATHPDRLLAVARWHGLVPGEAASARVLELGCGTGWNLLPMAAGMPGASFVGLDTSQVQIDIGQRHADALGLANLELRCDDLRAAPEGPFDAVIAHGLYSWVPADVQDALLATVRRVLAPAGVAFVSWNALPGWSVRQVVRDILRRHVDESAAPMAQVQAARDVLSLWSGSAARGAFGELLRQEAARLLGKRDPTIFHDYLAPDNEPVYVDTFRQRVAARGLRILGEAEIGTDRGDAGMLGDGIGDPALGRDLLEGRAFRRSVLCRDDAVRGPGSLDDLFLRARVRPLGEVEPGTWAFGVGGEAQLVTENPDFAQMMDLLGGALPGALDPWTLEAAVACEASEVRRLMTACIDHGFVEPLARAPLVAAQLGPRPAAFAPARHLAAGGSPWVPSLLHEAVAVDAFDRVLLASLDGTCDQPALVDRLERAGHGVDEAPARLAAMVGAGLFPSGFPS